MKTRTSLVSNSSTSSFICLIPLKNHEEIVNKLVVDEEYHEIFRKILNSESLVKKMKKFGMDMVSFSRISGNVESPNPEELMENLTEKEQNLISNIDEEDEEAEEASEKIYEMMYKYEEEVGKLEKKNPENVFQGSTDC